LGSYLLFVKFYLFPMSKEVKVLTVDGRELVLDPAFLEVCSKVQKKVEGKISAIDQSTRFVRYAWSRKTI
jgi:hypothetical protein